MHRSIVRYGLGMVCAGLLAGAAWAQAGGTQTRFISEYRIGPKDLLDIRVINGDKFNTLVRVTEDGKISVPFLGEVDVDGLTAGELEKKLAQTMIDKGFLRDPQVSVLIKEMQSRRVSVLGAVQNPGSFELLGRQTLLQIISMAGGLTRDAAMEIIIIRRSPDGTATTLRVPVDELFNRGQTEFDIPLEPGDIVNVQVDRQVQIYIMGQVKTPGALTVLQSRIPSVTQAIAQAGGFTDRAAQGRVVIRRREADGKEKEIKVDVKAILKNRAKDVPLLEGDTVFVPQSLF